MGGEEKRDEGGSIKIVWTLELGNLDYFIIFPQITPSKKKLEHFDRLDPPPYLALHFALFALREPLRDCLCRSVRVAAFICELVVDHEERGRRRRRKPPPSPAPLSASRLFTEGGGGRRAKIPEENTHKVPPPPTYEATDPVRQHHARLFAPGDWDEGGRGLTQLRIY